MWKEEGKELYEEVLNRLPPRIVHFITHYAIDLLLKDGFLDAESLHNPHTFLSILCANAGVGTSYENDENTNSAIVRLSLNGKNILIMGDASAIATRRYLIDCRKNLTAAPHQQPLQNVQLSVVSHHGAKDKDGSNDGLWLSKKGPHHVAISAGYRYNGHPDLALFQEFILIDCLRDTENDVFLLEDLHSVTIGIPDFKDIEYAKGQLSPIFDFMAIDKNPKWSIFTTKKSIYSTASSGDLRYVFKADGSLVDFSREY